jgi:hypothetical protein
MVKFRLNESINPGTHWYKIYTDYKGVTSNFDTVSISFKEKSLIAIYAGYDRFKVTKGSDYFNFALLDILKFGLRGYITQRLSADLNVLIPFHFTDMSKDTTREIWTTLFSGKINYDILPWRIRDMHTGRLPAYLSGFVGCYQLTVSDESGENGYWQWGLGIKPRIQLVPGNTKIGVMYLELDAGFYTQFVKNPYKTWALGLNLIYGFWNY